MGLFCCSCCFESTETFEFNSVKSAISDVLRDYKLFSDEFLNELFSSNVSFLSNYPHFGLPNQPYIDTLVIMMIEWANSHSFPIPSILDIHIVGFGDSVIKQKIDDCVSLVNELVFMAKAWGRLDYNNRHRHLLQFLKHLNERGIMFLLGLSCTIGGNNIIRLPPSRAILIASFSEIHPGSRFLSVGARALSKHCHRSLCGFWGQIPNASEQQKSNNALLMLEKLLDNAIWRNFHVLPDGLEVFELRIQEGYGARFTSDGSKFRGFLEPLMHNGHELGWVH